MRVARRVTLFTLVILLFWVPNANAQEAINPYLQNMVDVRASSDERWKEAQKIITRMNNVENSILYQINNNMAIIILMDTPNTEKTKFIHLKGEVTRGHTK